MKNPQGNWGPYGGKGFPFIPFGWAMVNSDGTLHASSGNLLPFKGSAGVYTFEPTLDDGVTPANFPQNSLLVDAIGTSAPVVPLYTYGTGPGSHGFSLNLLLSGTPTDEAFIVKVFTTRAT